MDLPQDQTEKIIKPLALVILDGWGVAPPLGGNAVCAAKKPNFNRLIKSYPASVLAAHGRAIGLADDQPGDPENGYLAIGAGRPVHRGSAAIDAAINNGQFFKNKTLLAAVKHVQKHQGAIHLVGLLSESRSKSATEHLEALIDFCAQSGLKKVLVHPILGGLDSAHNAGAGLMEKLAVKINTAGCGRIASVAGRIYAMDRDRRWDLVALAYQALLAGKPVASVADPVEAVRAGYDRQIFDEEIAPLAFAEQSEPIGRVKDGDAVIFFNFRGDDLWELASALVLPGFEKFPVTIFKNLSVVFLGGESGHLPVSVAFPDEPFDQSLNAVLAAANLRQMKIAPAERYAHLTHFFDGLKDETTPLSQNVMVSVDPAKTGQSRAAATLKEIYKTFDAAVVKDQADFLAVSLPGVDLAAADGDFRAAVGAGEKIDGYLGKMADLILAKNGIMIVIGSHGHGEEMFNPQSGEINRQNSRSGVPFILIGRQWEGRTLNPVDAPAADLSLLKPSGSLIDVAPTILKLWQIEKPSEMTGRSLI